MRVVVKDDASHRLDPKGLIEKKAPFGAFLSCRSFCNHAGLSAGIAFERTF